MKISVIFALFCVVRSTEILDLNSLKFAFGSCYGWRNSTSEIFKTVTEVYDPSLWIWLGDAAYTDKKKENYDLQYIESRFNATRNAPQYNELLKHSKVIGVWDDHDYG
jgi:alkaline phosphatase D